MRSFAFIAGLVAALTTTTVLAEEYTRCAEIEPPQELLDMGPLDEPLDFLDAAAAAISVNVYVHVVTSTSKAGQFSQTMVNRQIDVMNDRYAPAGISFVLSGTDFTTNNAWAAAQPDTRTELAMKQSLHKGDYSDLNLYMLSDLAGGLLGVCNFPTSAVSSTTLTLDGCLVLASSMPGGTATNYNLGLTAVHEVGHWFGLYHVFQGQSCSGSGDQVSDTPIQSVATSGCPVGQDSCPNSAGVDNIRNYMDYSYDSCMTLFTAGQNTRMVNTYNSLRA